MQRPIPWKGRGAPATVRVVLTSPDTIFGEAVATCLAEVDGVDVVGLAIDATTLADAVDVLRPAVLVCDQRSPRGPLPPLVARCREVAEDLRTVLLATVAAPTQEEEAAFDAVVPPRSSLDRVSAAVREVAWYRGPTVAPAGATVPSLTGRELDVLRLLTRGLDTRAMAADLHLSPHTVRNHVRRLSAKLDTRSRVEAIAEGRRLGLV